MEDLKKIAFRDVFMENQDGTLSVRRPTSVSGVVLTPDTAFGPGVLVGGIDFSKFKNRSVAIEEKENKFIIRGFFKE